MSIFFLHVNKAQLNNSISTDFIQILPVNQSKDDKHYQYLFLVEVEEMKKYGLIQEYIFSNEIPTLIKFQINLVLFSSITIFIQSLFSLVQSD